MDRLDVEFAKPDDPICNLTDGNDACSKSNNLGHLNHSNSLPTGCSGIRGVVRIALVRVAENEILQGRKRIATEDGIAR